MTKAQEIADIIIGEMFAPHELPLDDELAGRYLGIANKVLAALSQTSKQIDPAELWELYLEEIRADQGTPSPQGAMAFAVDALTRPLRQSQEG